MFASGNFAEAEEELERSKNREYPTCMRARAKLMLVRQEYNQAEQVLGKYLKQERKKGLRDRPEFLDPKLDLAEAFFGQTKHDDAFASMQEARSIVADFALPPDAAWRKSLETWLQRAREIGKADVAASLDAELQVMPAAVEQRVTILEKFRIREKDGG